MSEKDYDSIDYIGFKIRESLRRMLLERVGAEVNITYSYIPNKDIGFITYSISKIISNITISRRKEKFHMLEEITSENFNSKQEYEGFMKLRRSKTGRLSGKYTDAVARRSLKRIKYFYEKSRKTD